MFTHMENYIFYTYIYKYWCTYTYTAYRIPVYLFICLSIYLAISYPWSLEVASCDTIQELKKSPGRKDCQNQPEHWPQQQQEE